MTMQSKIFQPEVKKSKRWAYNFKKSSTVKITTTVLSRKPSTGPYSAITFGLVSSPRVMELSRIRAVMHLTKAFFNKISYPFSCPLQFSHVSIYRIKILTSHQDRLLKILRIQMKPYHQRTLQPTPQVDSSHCIRWLRSPQSRLAAYPLLFVPRRFTLRYKTQTIKHNIYRQPPNPLAETIKDRWTLFDIEVQPIATCAS